MALRRGTMGNVGCFFRNYHRTMHKHCEMAVFSRSGGYSMAHCCSLVATQFWRF